MTEAAAKGRGERQDENPSPPSMNAGCCRDVAGEREVNNTKMKPRRTYEQQETTLVGWDKGRHLTLEDGREHPGSLR